MKYLSMRYLSWAACTATVTAFPAFEAQIPMYRKTIPLIDAGRPVIIDRSENLGLSPQGAALAERCEHHVPGRIRRIVALVELPGATVLGNTGAVVDEAKHAVLLPRDQPQAVTYRQMRGLMRKKIVKPARNYFNMVGPHRGHRHYFHFLIEYLPRFHYLLHEFPLGRDGVTVLINEDLSRLQSGLFALLSQRHPNLRFERMPYGERWQFPRLYCLDSHVSAEEPGRRILRVIPSRAGVEFARQLIFDLFDISPPATPSRRLFVSRSDAAKRRLLNEPDLHNVLTRHGFEIVVPGTLPVAAQAELFSQAAAVCGPHGAGLTNILFAPPGARIVEIFPATRIPGHYLALGKVLGHSHSAIIAGPENRSGNFTVEPAELDAVLARLR